MNRYFKKELVQNVLMDSKGRKIPFESIDGDTGLAIFNEDKPEEFDFIEALDALIGNRRGGVFAITEEEYHAEKKRLQSTPSRRQLRPSVIKALKPLSPYRQPQNAEAADEGKSVKGSTPDPAPEKPSTPEPTAGVSTEGDSPWGDEDFEAPRLASVNKANGPFRQD